MNLKEAKRILGGKLVFGNEDQIQAVRFMEKVGECREKAENCVYEHRYTFKGWQGVRECVCTMEFDGEVVDAAIRKLNGDD